MQAGGQRFDPVQLHHLFEGIDANQLEVESPHCEFGSRALILELVAKAICLQRAPVARSSSMKLLQTIFDN